MPKKSGGPFTRSNRKTTGKGRKQPGATSISLKDDDQGGIKLTLKDDESGPLKLTLKDEESGATKITLQPEPEPRKRLAKPTLQSGGPAPKTVAQLGLSTRALEALAAGDIRTVKALAKQKPADLLALENFGRGALDEVRRKLRAHGITLQGDDEGPPRRRTPSRPRR